MVDVPENTIGYGAVVMPHLDEFQGFFIVDDPALHREAVTMQMMALAATPSGVIGALQAAIVEGITTRNFHLVGVAALALHGVTKRKFFWIKAFRESGGTRTEMLPLQAEDVRDAQAEIGELPLVVEIKERLRAAVRARKH